MTSQPSASPDQSWRGSPVSARPTRSRHLGRAVMTLVCLALVGLVGYQLWRWMVLPNAYFACLPIRDYGLLAAPVMPFSDEEAAAFAAASPHPSVLLQELQHSKAIGTLSARLQGAVARPKDHLVFFLRAHGIADHRKAFVLCSDYLSQDSQDKPGWYPLEEVLKQVCQCRASLKLLLLDCGYMPAVPRLGAVVDEFPQLLDEYVKDTRDDTLWVIAAVGPLEAAHVARGARRSVFAYFAAEGLRGAADGNGDGEVDLGELFGFVQRGVAGWVDRASDGQESQTPRLFHGGEGAVAAAPAKLALLLNASRRNQPPAADASAGTDPDGAAPQGKQEPSDKKEARKPLDDAWRLHDQLQDRHGRGDWSPIDYAPHLWREYEALLLACELRCQYASTRQVQESMEFLRSQVLALGDMTAKDSPVASDDKTISGRLANARRQFLKGSAVASFGRGPQELAVKKAVQLKNDLTFRATDYVRWHACASRVEVPLYDRISKLLEKLADFTRQLEDVEATASTAETSVMQSRLKEIGDQVQTLRDWQEKIELNGLAGEAEELLGNARSRDRAGRIEAILHTGLVLLPADTRTRMLAALDKLEEPPLSPDVPADGPREPRPIAAWQWDRLAEQSQLETQLLRLVDRNVRIAQPGRPGNTGAADWDRYREFGEVLREFYAGLPGEIGRCPSTPDLAQKQLTERQLRMVNARDASRPEIGDQALALAVRPIAIAAAPEDMAVKTAPPPTAPDIVKLQVEGDPPAVAETQPAVAETQQDAIRLRPFPNRTTRYRFALVNRSGRAREVTVQLLALSESPSPRWRGEAPPDEKELFDLSGNLREGVKELGKAGRMSLTADATPRPIDFPEPKPAAAEPPTAKPAAAAAGPPKRPLSQRWACVIRDAATQARWIAGIDVDPCLPRHYVTGDVSVVRAERKITVKLRAGNPRTAPPVSPEHPLTVRWQVKDADGLDVKRLHNDHAEILPGQVAELSAFIAPEMQQKVPVQLTVDGCDRALVYRVPSNQDQESVERERSLRSIRIASPQPNAAFDASPDAPTSTLPVVIEVDAPETAFQRPDDLVRVGIDADGDGKIDGGKAVEFFNDRQVQVFPNDVTVGPQGRVTVFTKVDDFRIQLPRGGLRNAKVNIIAQLVLAGRVPERCSMTVPVLLDGLPPEFRIDARNVPRGTPLQVAIEVTNLTDWFSGLKEVEFKLDQKSQTVHKADTDGQWRTSFNTQELALGEYELTVRATNRVGRSNEKKHTVTIASPAPVVVAPATGTITGHVVLDNDDRPLAEIHVSLRGTKRKTDTDAEGAFSFADVPLGKYTIDAEGLAVRRPAKNSIEIELKDAKEPAVAEIRLRW